MKSNAANGQIMMNINYNKARNMKKEKLFWFASACVIENSREKKVTNETKDKRNEQMKWKTYSFDPILVSDRR